MAKDFKYSVEYIDGCCKAIVKYQRYRCIHNKVFAAITSLWIAFTLLCILSIHKLGAYYAFGSFLIGFITYAIPFLSWCGYVDRINKKREESLIYPIIDKKLKSLEEKYPSACKVVKRKLIKEPAEKSAYLPEDETVLVALSNGDICEFPFKFKDEIDGERTIVRVLSLTSYICNDERKIAKLKGWIPTISFNDMLKIFCAIALFIAALIIFPTFYFLSNTGSTKITAIILGTLFVVSMITYALGNYLIKNKKTKYIGEILTMPFSVVSMLMKLGMPLVAIITDILFILLATAGPVLSIILIMTEAFQFNITSSTRWFITLLVSSFLMVYCPSYIRWIINLIPMVKHTEGSKTREGLADFMRYVYDANVIDFIINCAYVLLVGIICFMKYQDKGVLISANIDDAIMNSFVVYLAFEGVKTSYKKIKLDAKSFFIKLVRILIG